MKCKVILILTTLACLTLPSAHAAFRDILVSPQTAATGNTSLSSLDSTSMFLNPAGIGGVQRGEMYMMHQQLYAGLEDAANMQQGFIATAFPFKRFVLGVGLGTFRAQGLLEERVVSVSLAKRFASGLKGGFTIKQLYHNYLIGSDPLALMDPVFRNGTSANAFGIDAGVIATVIRPLSLGLVVRNINQPDVGLVTEDRVPRVVQIGAAYDFPKAGIKALADFSYRNNHYGEFRDKTLPALGMEKSIDNGRVKFRLGANTLEYTGGVGLQLGRWGLDYSLIIRPKLMADNSGTHMLGLRLLFGGSNDS